MNEKHKLIKWLKNQVRDSDPEQPLRVIVLLHTSAGAENLAKWEDFSDKSDNGIDTMASEVERAAEDDAQGVGGSQSYVLRPYFGKSTTPFGRFTFTVHAPDVDFANVDGDIREMPNEKGIRMMLMRQNENLLRSTFAIMGDMTRTMSKTIKDQQDYISTMERQRVEGVEIYQQLMDRKQDRDVARMKELNNERRKEEIGRVVMPAVPALLSKLTAGAIPATTAITPEMQALSGLVKSFTDEQWEVFYNASNPGQRIGLMQLREFVTSQEAKQIEAERELTNSVANGMQVPENMPNPLVDSEGVN